MPPQVEITDGEDGYDTARFRRLLAADAVDGVMADATRCGGITGFLKVSALCEAWSLLLSTHCAPALHLHVACACAPLRHFVYFHDHARIENLLFADTVQPEGSALRPEASQPGHGLAFKWAEAARFAV